MYKQAGFHEEAINALKETSNYQMLFTLAINLGPEKLKEIVIDYVAKLDEKKLYKEAGYVLSEHHFGIPEL